MKKFLVEYLLIPGGLVKFLIVDAVNKAKAKNFVDESYSPYLIKNIEFYKENL